MEDFISRQAAINAIENDLLEVVFYTKEDAIDCLKYIPNVDCIKQCKEVELRNKKILTLEAEKDALIKNYANCMKDYAKFIFEELESVLVSNGNFLMLPHATYETIKKIYTEGKK
jgi:hypothetical protein